MITQATVISIEGEFAVVEAHRKSACDGCHKNKDGESCSICTLTGGDSVVRLRVRNPIGAAVGDKVCVSTDTRRVLGYAWLVFLFPLAVAGLGWWVGMKLWEREMLGAVCALAGMALSFVGIWLYSKISVSRRCDAEIVSIIEK
ncbi:MAG: SoxR reducing system RseC family protein [Clostridia bacterium]|nr:SoxR reducing system RseC family protein [Clostridia bacterium]